MFYCLFFLLNRIAFAFHYISWANGFSFSLAENLISSLTNFGLIQNFTLYCSDASCYHLCKQRKFQFCSRFSSVDSEWSFSEEVRMTKFGLIRLKTIDEVLQKNESVFIFDLDIGLRTSPLHFYYSNMDADMAFQPDRNAPSDVINVGFGFLHPKDNVKLLVAEVIRELVRSDGWEQSIFNDIYQNNFKDKIRLKLFDESSARNLMLHYDGDFTSLRVQGTVRDAAMIHLTCVDGSLKEYILKSLGFFANVNEYYSRPIIAYNIQSLNSSSYIESVRLFEAHLDNVYDLKMKATVPIVIVPPHSISIGSVEHPVPFYKFVHVQRTIKTAGVEIVENNYLQHRTKYVANDIHLHIYNPIVSSLSRTDSRATYCVLESAGGCLSQCSSFASPKMSMA